MTLTIKYLIFGLCPLFIACSSGSEKHTDQNDISPEYVIAYNVLTDSENDNYEVFTMNLDGSEKRNITNLDGVEWTYYAFKDKLYFISDKDTCQRCVYHLYVTDYMGNHPRKVSEIPLADSWLSSRNNGAELIVRPNPQYDSAFLIIDTTGSIVARVKPDLPGFYDPLFIDDGRKIVFRGGTRTSKREPDYQEELYIMNSDGSNLQQLTHYPEADTTAPWYAYKAGTPKLNPSDDYITYQSFQNGKYSLFAVTTDGTKQWKLTENQANEGWHDWSPDGKWLAIELFDDDQQQFNIGLMDWQTKQMKLLTDTTYTYQQAPKFLLKQ